MNAFNAVVHMATVGVLMAIAGSAGAQQAYPNKPIRFIVPFAAGGGTDTVACLLGPKLTESWGQQLVVDSRPGGTGHVAAEVLRHWYEDDYLPAKAKEKK